jgi:anthranilate phosphoribosyltransferase
MRHTAVPRRELGVPTVFNFLGPLTNPAQPKAQAVGVSDARMAPVVAGVLADRGASALVFRGEDGLDELSTAAPSRIWRVLNGQVIEDKLDPADLGIATATADALRGGDAATNAAAALSMLAGDRGAVRDAVLLNAAAALVAVAASDEPLTGQLHAAIGRAAESVDSGAAAKALESWVETSVALRPAAS